MNTTTNITYLPTKANIVQRLLEEKHITAEEAVILLTNDVPVSPVAPTSPYTIRPFPGYPQPYVYCSTSHYPKK